MWFAILFQLFIIIILLSIWMVMVYTFWLNLFYPPFIPTVNKKTTLEISKYIQNHSELRVFCEPGCGLAGVSREIEIKHPNLQYIAVEYNFLIYLLAKLSLAFSRSKVNLYHGDFTKFDLSSKINGEQALIYCYLLPDLMSKFRQAGKFDKATVLSLDFNIPQVEPIDTIQIGKNGFQKQIRIYKF